MMFKYVLRLYINSFSTKTVGRSQSLFLTHVVDFQPYGYRGLELLPTAREKCHLVSEDLVRMESWIEN